jgi:uncharacterized membrane protein
MMKPQQAEEQHRHWIGGLLRSGVVLSAAMMVAGIAGLLASNAGMMDQDLRRTAVQLLEELIRPELHATPLFVLLLYGGLVLLMVTPVLRVATVVVTFLLEKDHRFAVISLIVLLMLVSEIFFALR